MTKDEVDNYFKLKEMRYIKDAENIWHLKFRGRISSYHRYFEIVVVLVEEWLYLRVPLLLADNQTCWPYLTEYLLGLNYSLFLTTIAAQGRQILLNADLPARCSMADLDEVITSVDMYVRAYYLDIETVATCPAIAAIVHTAIEDVTGGANIGEHEAIPVIIFSD